MHIKKGKKNQSEYCKSECSRECFYIRPRHNLTSHHHLNMRSNNHHTDQAQKNLLGMDKMLDFCVVFLSFLAVEYLWKLSKVDALEILLIYGKIIFIYFRMEFYI